MLRRITDMPTGTIGFEAIGEVEDDDWMRPALGALSFLLPGKAKGLPGERADGREGMARRGARCLETVPRR
jgi:hypothetical protein